jgi:F420-dependent oxidoreductase-like protein
MVHAMKVSLKLRFSSMDAFARLGTEAERLRLHGVWLSEPWGFDATPILGWLAARTERVLLGTHVLSVYSRTPATFAGLAASLQRVSGGRFRLGLGTSGPQVVEGWHGVPFERPVERTRDVIAVVRAALRGEPVRLDGRSVTLPRPGGAGRPLRFAQLGEPMTVPIYVAAMGDRNLELTGELADGWIPFPWSPAGAAGYAAPLAAGRALRAADRGCLALAPSCSVAFGAVDELRRAERANVAFYLGAMGTSAENFYVRAVTRLGFGGVADAVQTAWLAGDHDAARSAVSDELIDAITIFGDTSVAARRLAAYEAAGVDELVVELRRRAVDDQVADLRTLTGLL